MQEATNARKTQLNYMIKSLKDKALEKRKDVEQFNQKKIEVQAQVADVKSQVQTNVDQMTAIIEARKQDVFDAVDNQAKKSLETLSQKKGEAENQVKIIESAIEQTEALLKRNLNAEILGFNETLDCKTVGFFLKISKEIGNAWRKSLMRANRASLPSLALCFQPRSTPFV